MRGLMILSDNCEDLEALGTRALLKRAGIDVDTVTVNQNKKITTAFGLTVEADFYKDDIDLVDYQFLIIPGGKYVSMIIEKETYIKTLIKAFDKSNKMIAAICAGPRFLGDLGLLENKHYTIFKGLEEARFKGTYESTEKVVRDGLIITGRGAGVTIDFSLEIINFVKSSEAAKQIKNSILL